jgi:hypothetical protein
MPFAAGRGAGTRGFRQVPVRSVLFAAVLAVVMVVATLTFATSLNTLVSHPPLYGWNWNYVLYPTNAVPPQARHLLSHDPLVAGWAGLDYTDAQIDGQAVPIILGRPGAKVAPPILSGHDLDGKGQIVLGAATLSLLHKHIGDTVSLGYETAKDAPEYPRPGCGTHAGRSGATGRVTRSWTLQEPQIEGPEHQDNSDVYHQPRPEVVPEEQDIHADHEGYQREHVGHHGCRSSHRFVLLRAAQRSKNGVRLHRATVAQHVAWHLAGSG